MKAEASTVKGDKRESDKNTFFFFFFNYFKLFLIFACLFIFLILFYF